MHDAVKLEKCKCYVSASIWLYFCSISSTYYFYNFLHIWSGSSIHNYLRWVVTVLLMHQLILWCCYFNFQILSSWKLQSDVTQKIFKQVRMCVSNRTILQLLCYNFLVGHGCSCIAIRWHASASWRDCIIVMHTFLLTGTAFVCQTEFATAILL